LPYFLYLITVNIPLIFFGNFDDKFIPNSLSSHKIKVSIILSVTIQNHLEHLYTSFNKQYFPLFIKHDFLFIFLLLFRLLFLHSREIFFLHLDRNKFTYIKLCQYFIFQIFFNNTCRFRKKNMFINHLFKLSPSMIFYFNCSQK